MHVTGATPTETRRSTRRRRTFTLIAGGFGACVALVQLRHGIVPLLDTVTYWSGAESVVAGRPFRTTLAPSFSNFDAVQFLDKGGRLPFVDFPIAYPLSAGLLGLVMGARAAMHVLTVIAVAVVTGAVVAGGLLGRTRRTTTGAVDVAGESNLWIRSIAAVLFACLVPFLPAMRLVTQGTLSEPLFIAAVMVFVVALARFRQGGAWSPVVALVVVGSLLRFLGAPLAVLAGWEHHQRDGNAMRSLAWTSAMLVPAAANIAVAAAAGGGHSAGWRGIDRLDVDIFVRSVGGWFDATQGDIRRTYFTADGPSWWSWPMTIAVVAAMVVGVLAVLRRTTALPDAAQLALASAAILSTGLVAGILGFDALVIADNRLMLPAGILVTSALAWTLIDALRDRRSFRPIFAAVVVGTIVLWGVTAVRPWNALERFSDIDRPLAMSTMAANLGVEIVISNDADGVHWDTGIPAAYTPMEIKPLTGEAVDDREATMRLPCPLLRARGAIVIDNQATFSTVNREALDDLVESGKLRVLTSDRATAFLPTESACDE